MNNDTGIYSITSPSGGQYIGSAISFKKRWREHKRILRLGKHHSPALQAAWDKYGEHAMVFAPVIRCLATELWHFEQALIDRLKPRYNVASRVDAPMFGRKFSAETLAKMAASHLGRKQSPEAIASRVKSREGYAHSESTRQRMREASVGRKCTPEHIEKNRKARKVRGEEHPAYGKTLPDWHKELLSKVHKGKIIPDDVRLRTSETMKGMNAGGANPVAKAVICVETGATFECISYAVAWLRENGKPKAVVSPISAVCMGKRKYKTAYGYSWRYASQT